VWDLLLLLLLYLMHAVIGVVIMIVIVELGGMLISHFKHYVNSSYKVKFGQFHDL
jgi:hypothetical protein